ncbi:MAG: CoA-binding protein [Acidimicrobiia bacterium]|nr:CoA-binding protein [Acidimicrobiia bacterium]
MRDIAQLLTDPSTTVAVIGANDDPAKYGGRIYRDLKAKGFKVFAVNPNRDTVDGDPSFKSLEDLPESPTIVNFVVPPQRTLRILQKCRELGLLDVWIQPGAESEEVISYLDEAGFNYLANACIMVHSLSTA